MKITGPENDFSDGFDMAAKHDAEEFKRLDAEIVSLKDTLRDAMAELLTIGGERVPGEEFDCQKYAAGAVEHLHKKMRMLGINLHRQ